MMAFFHYLFEMYEYSGHMYLSLYRIIINRMYGNFQFDLHSNSFFQVISIFYWQFWLGPEKFAGGWEYKVYISISTLEL